ncbi:tetratricopeptide repeat protein [Sediminicola sp. 1XM1-17]|uniref:tetratricopeptide repeat protein n=1 Tax=Sediminicola sp. 1XM1-17 TaxID=3127702 RepID=UPI003076C261
MKKRLHFLLLCIAVLLSAGHIFAQEPEESAEIMLEAYSDEFQEKFFEALKQKGIENYDRAINLFLECKAMDNNNPVIDHELAKSYALNRDFINAQDYVLKAINLAPENFWFLHTLVDITEKQGNSFDTVRALIPYSNEMLREHLAQIYYNRQNYDNALFVLEGLRKTSAVNTLRRRIADAKGEDVSSDLEEEVEQQGEKEESPLDDFMMGMAQLIEKEDFKQLETVSAEALETFPLQPYFYYARGLALNKLSRHKEAVAVMEEGLDYLLEDQLLANKFHKELANAHIALGNSSKANMYLSKIKTRS